MSIEKRTAARLAASGLESSGAMHDVHFTRIARHSAGYAQLSPNLPIRDGNFSRIADYDFHKAHLTESNLVQQVNPDLWVVRSN